MKTQPEQRVTAPGAPRTATTAVTAPQPSLWAWFHPVNWLAGFIAFAASFATYIFTLQPTVGLEDSGELICAAYRLGVPHPPGYPVWTILGKLFTFIPLGDVAYRVNMLSAISGALAAGIVALVLAKTGDIFFGDQEEELGRHHLLPVFERFGITTPRLVNSLIAIVAGVLFAFTPGTWSQSTIAEVYALNCFFMATVVLLSLVLMFNPQRREVWYWLAFVFGLGIVTHQTIVVMAVALGWLVFCTSKSFDHFVQWAANAVILLVFTLGMFHFQRYFGPNVWDLKMLPFGFDFSGGYMQGFFKNFFVSFCGPFLLYLAAAYYVNKTLYNSTDWVKTVGAFFAGLATYFYMPLASATNPQMNWGRPRTVEGFWHSILRGQYEKPSFKRDPFYFLQQVILYLKDTWDQYPMVLIFAFISIITLVVMWQRARIRNWLVYTILVWFGCGIGMVFLMNPKLDITSQYINRVFFIMGHAGLGLLVGYGMLMTAVGLFSLARRKEPAWRVLALAVGVIIAMYGAVFVLCSVIKPDNVTGVLGTIANSISVPDTLRLPFYIGFGSVFLIIGVLVIIGVLQVVKSYIASVAIAVLLLATPFISAIENWAEMNLRTKYFGYVFGIEMLKVCEPNTIFFGGTDPGRFVPEYLIGCNQFRGDIWLITQNGLADNTYMSVLRDRYCKVRGVWPAVRTFLRWINAEREDPLRADPKSRDPKLGTIYIPSQQDFEKAFQIYIQDVEARKKRGEHIEEDVQIVGGKISVGGVSGVMKLNGILCDFIWKENKATHNFYVEESYVIPWMYPYLEPAGLIMKLNKDPVQITPETVARDFAYWNNLTSVFSQGGVIDYDDIVALYWQELKAVYDAQPGTPKDAVVSQAWERAVAQSVSAPNMKLNTLLSVKYLNDLYEIYKDGREVEFAQTRGRIVVKPGEFADDEPAQKSFSKARSASAGVYEFHGMWREAEMAYQQALWLYPKSAEAYMRLASMFLKIGRYDDALELAKDYKRKDPLNDRVDGMIGAIEAERARQMEFNDLQNRVLAGSNAAPQDYVRLIDAHRARGNDAAMRQITELFLANTNAVTNPEAYQYLLQIYGQRNDLGEMTRLLERVTAVTPHDWAPWLDLAVLRMAGGNMEEGFTCIDRALAINRKDAVRRLAQDPRFQRLRNYPDPAVKERFLSYLK